MKNSVVLVTRVTICVIITKEFFIIFVWPVWIYIYIYIYIYINHYHHHCMPQARISLTLSSHSSLSSIAPGRSSRLHPVSVQSCCRYVLAGHPTLARPCEGVHRTTSLMSSSLLLQQCLAGFLCLIWMVFEMGGRWAYSCCFVGCCLQDLFNTACSILMQLLSSFSTIRLVSVHVVHPCSNTDTTFAWKKLCFI